MLYSSCNDPIEKVTSQTGSVFVLSTPSSNTSCMVRSMNPLPDKQLQRRGAAARTTGPDPSSRGHLAVQSNELALWYASASWHRAPSIPPWCHAEPPSPSSADPGEERVLGKSMQSLPQSFGLTDRSLLLWHAAPDLAFPLLTGGGLVEWPSGGSGLVLPSNWVGLEVFYAGAEQKGTRLP